MYSGRTAVAKARQETKRRAKKRAEKQRRTTPARKSKDRPAATRTTEKTSNGKGAAAKRRRRSEVEPVAATPAPDGTVVSERSLRDFMHDLLNAMFGVYSSVDYCLDVLDDPQPDLPEIR